MLNAERKRRMPKCIYFCGHSFLLSASTRDLLPTCYLLPTTVLTYYILRPGTYRLRLPNTHLPPLCNCYFFLRHASTAAKQSARGRTTDQKLARPGAGGHAHQLTPAGYPVLIGIRPTKPGVQLETQTVMAEVLSRIKTSLGHFDFRPHRSPVTWFRPRAQPPQTPGHRVQAQTTGTTT